MIPCAAHWQPLPFTGTMRALALHWSLLTATVVRPARRHHRWRR